MGGNSSKRQRKIKTKTRTMTRTKKEESIEVICRKILAEIGKCPEAAFGLGVQNPHKVKTVYYIQRKRQNGQNRTVCVKRGMR